jgi:hypothetical protein
LGNACVGALRAALSPKGVLTVQFAKRVHTEGEYVLVVIYYLVIGMARIGWI